MLPTTIATVWRDPSVADCSPYAAWSCEGVRPGGAVAAAAPALVRPAAVAVLAARTSVSHDAWPDGPDGGHAA